MLTGNQLGVNAMDQLYVINYRTYASQTARVVTFQYPGSIGMAIGMAIGIIERLKMYDNVSSDYWLVPA